MPAKVRSLLCAAFMPCGERNSNVSGPSETRICRPPFAALAHSVFVQWVAVLYKPFYVPSKYFGRNARRKNGREAQRKYRCTGKENKEEKMTAGELMHHNFDEIFIEL